MDGYATGGMQYYQDDGLGGLGGDDGLGGLGGYAPPQPPMYGDDGLMYLPMDEPVPANEPQADNQEELAELLDVGLFGTEPSQAASQPDSASPLPGDDDEDDEASEDEQDFDDVDEGGQEQQLLSVQEEQQQEEQQPELLDPEASEAQRQNAWYKECFDAMSEAQRNRLEAYIRSNLQKKTMKKVLQELTGTALNDRIVLAIGTITKMFVGELIETARQIAAHQAHTGPLLPSHIRQAYNALNFDNRVPHHSKPKPMRLQ
jgi:transcription initiation factor TFIID subunit 11